jgi:MFS family permease
VASAALFGLSAWSIPAVMSAACGDTVGARLAPAALGFITLFFGAGQTLGPAVAGALADRFGSLAPAMWTASAASALGAIGTLVLLPPTNVCRPRELPV